MGSVEAVGAAVVEEEKARKIVLAAARAEYERRVIVYDPDVPGLVTLKLAVVDEKRIGAWKFQRLDDGGLFMSHWRGAEDCEQMVGFELFNAVEASILAALLEG